MTSILLVIGKPSNYPLFILKCDVISSFILSALCSCGLPLFHCPSIIPPSVGFGQLAFFPHEQTIAVFAQRLYSAELYSRTAIQRVVLSVWSQATYSAFCIQLLISFSLGHDTECYKTKLLLNWLNGYKLWKKLWTDSLLSRSTYSLWKHCKGQVNITSNTSLNNHLRTKKHSFTKYHKTFMVHDKEPQLHKVTLFNLTTQDGTINAIAK